MAITFTDIADIGSEEVNGLVVSLKRQGFVQGLTSTTPNGYAAEIYGSGAVPSSGSSVTVNGSVLYLTKRSFVIGSKEGKGDATVNLLYERRDTAAAEGGTPKLRGGSTLKQIETAKNSDGTDIVVTHDWPSDTTAQYANGETKADTTETRGGTIAVMVPMSTISGSYVQQTASPGAITKAYIGKLNSTTWQGGAARTWMCTSFTFELVDDTLSPPLYRFDFTFEYDDQTWDNDTTVVFIDEDTGSPVTPLVDGESIVTVPYYDTANFNNIA